MGQRHEADIQATQQKACEQARIPTPDEHQGGPEDPRASPQEGPSAPDRHDRLEVDEVNGGARRKPDLDPEPPHAPSGSGERLPRSSRIRRTRDIRTLLGRGNRRKTSHLDVFFAFPPDAHQSRFGLIVPKHRHSGVERNRLKRRLRELGRRKVLPRFRKAGLAVDFMVRARREAYRAPWRALEEELVEVADAICSDPSCWG